MKRLVGDGVILLFGNNESPCNYPNNAYYPFRQDSSFLYYFGQQRDGLVGVIDVDNNVETLVGDDIDIEDIVWYGSVDSVADMAAQVGVANSAPMKQLQALIYAGRVHIEDNPVTHWMFSNVVCHEDAKENVYPRKEKKENKIDGAVAMIMAVNQIIQLDVENNYNDDAASIELDWGSVRI